MTRRYKRNRSSPKKHTVKKHRRGNKSVRGYTRGKGKGKPVHTNTITTRRRVMWKASDTRTQRRRDILKSIPKNLSAKNRLRKAAEKLQRIALDSNSSKADKVKANSDYDYFTERIQKFQNPVFSPQQKAMAIQLMQKNSYIGRSVDFTFRDFEKAHRAAEDELMSQGKLVNMENIQDHMRRRFGFIDQGHGTETPVAA